MIDAPDLIKELQVAAELMGDMCPQSIWVWAMETSRLAPYMPTLIEMALACDDGAVSLSEAFDPMTFSFMMRGVFRMSNHLNLTTVARILSLEPTVTWHEDHGVWRWNGDVDA